MDLSIIIVSYNTKKLLDNCLASVLRTNNKKREVIIVDNGSTDGSKEMVRAKYPDVTLIINNKNEGFGKANNQGIRKAVGEYILLLNSDTVVQWDAIEKMAKFSKLHPNVFVGPKLYNADGTPQTSGGPFFTLPVVFASLFLKGDVNGLTRQSPNNTRYIDWVSGAALMAPKKLFMDDLLFDEGIFMYMEEIDLLMRARAKGYRTMFFPDAHITHAGAASSTDKRRSPVLNIYRGFLYLYKKHYNKVSLGMLRVFLKAKAQLAIAVGKLSGNSELVSLYEEAYRLVG